MIDRGMMGVSGWWSDCEEVGNGVNGGHGDVKLSEYGIGIFALKSRDDD